MPGINLTHDEARKRAAIVMVDHYDVHLDLRAEAPTFLSRTRVSFDATPGSATFVDLIADEVTSITLNGTDVDVSAWEDSRISLTNLAEHNTLEVTANCVYMHTGEGMHRFTDPLDKRDYVYTQFEVPDARRVFAVFEQPDLKATFAFTVDVAEDWTVLSNSATPTPTPLPDGGRRFAFETHPRISSYITAIVAGPYVGLTDELVNSEGRAIPLSVWARASLEEELRADAEEIFTITKQGFAFYESQFSRAYPFATYDQIFVPEYNAGAMENAGCVTFRDEYIFRSTPTQAERVRRANTILHELAHMWFGDLVTMKWWNDLWLNESFAEFMAYLSEAEATEFSDAWTAFNIRKEWGVMCDQLPSTHPIKAEIRDLADVEVNFDGITYSKGAAVLRQLVSYVGRDNFMTGLTRYFEAHAWGNATLTDLLSQLEATSGRDLTAWADVWLSQAGITVLRTDITEAADGSIESLDVVEELPQADTTHRPHRLAIGGYDMVGDALERVWRVEVDVNGERTRVDEATGLVRPALILVNDDDLTYAKSRLDDASLAVAGRNVDKLTDPMPRALIASIMWSMCRDGELSAPAYLDFCLRLLAVETNSDVVSGTLAKALTALNQFTSPAVTVQAHADFAQQLLALASSLPGGSDRQKQMAEAFIRVAVDPHRDLLENWLEGRDLLEGFELSQQARWAIRQTLSAMGAPATDLAAEEARDPSLTGMQMAEGARAASPTGRTEVFERIMTDTSVPNATLMELMGGFVSHAWRDPQRDEDLIDRYFASVREVWQTFTHHMASRIVAGMYPTHLTGRTDRDVVAIGRAWLDDNADAPRALRRLMAEQLDHAERAQRAQACDTTVW
ncbi:aminopeptidase N [Nanchangia anserum]|uniref:Aminopeptidase N n=1 Tax=Nanchangia anserum TaxID=2692125 RepID=A0A8I0KVF5_9ACTO|nr:aminopeptidase N [Nanchangia anserum]MBD3688884.1 aminopeptidase N [Nanchangia anserum]QOX81151.1 aminopeptidase N [Nanchangia anserum]